ncbi:MFS transporter [Chloroflexota bacterium]
MQREKNQAGSNQSILKAGRKPFYGWVVAIAGAFVFLAAGNFQYSFGVFIKPLINNFGWSRAAISGCVTTRFMISGLASPIAGILSDRYGPRKFILLAIFLTGLSYILASRITNLWQLYLSLSLLTGIGMTTAFVPVVSTVTRWFGEKSALANGIVMSGFGMAQMVVPPLATYLIAKYGWDTCFLILGLAAWGLGTLAWSFIRTPPDAMSRLRDESTEKDTAKANDTPAEAMVQYTLSEALHTRTFWNMLIFFMIVAGSYQMVMIHIVAAAIDTGISAEAAAIILTLGGITNTSGRLIFGALASKIGNKTVLTLCVAAQALALLFLVGASDLYVFYIVTSAYGMAYGAIPVLMPTLTGKFFGTKSMGSIYGIVVFSYTTGAAIGPFLAGYIFDVTGSYSMAFLSAGIALGMAFLLSLLLKPPHRKALISA